MIKTLETLEGRLVDLVRLSKIYKRPPVRGYLFYFEKSDNYAIITGGGFTQPLNKDAIITIHNNYIIVE